MISLETTAALAAMEALPPEGVPMDLEQLVSSFESTSWEWDSGRGLYLVDRFAPGYAARFQRERNSVPHVEIAVRYASGALEWPTAKSAIRACVLHYVLLETMTPDRAAQHIAGLTADYFTRARGTVPGIAPVACPPIGVWL